MPHTNPQADAIGQAVAEYLEPMFDKLCVCVLLGQVGNLECDVTSLIQLRLDIVESFFT